MKFKLIVEDSTRKYKIYNNGEKDIRVYDGDEIPQGFIKGSKYHKVPWNKGLTADTDERVKSNVEKSHETRSKNGYTAWNKGLTKETDERVANNSINSQQALLLKYNVTNPGQLPHDAWNKGLTADTDERVAKISSSNKGKTPWNKDKTGLPGHPHSEETKKHLSDIHLDPEFKQKRYDSMKANNTLGINSDTKAELAVYKYLCDKYGEDDIIKQYFDKQRYPYKCDFYIKSQDEFIEVHGNWTHGGKAYDPNDEECQKQLAIWQEKAKKSKFYENAIYTWTQLDVKKKEIAEKNHLNFKTIYYKY